MTASTPSVPATSAHTVTRLGITAAITAVVVASLPLAFDAISMKGERVGRSTAPITLAGASGGSPVDHSRSTAPAQLAGDAPARVSSTRSSAPVSLW